MWNHLDKYRDAGLLIARIGLGFMFAFVHGWPKLTGGPELWAKVGGAMSRFGLGFYPEFWGFMAMTAEFGGGLLLALGLWFRPALAVMVFTMFVAAVHHLASGDSLGTASHAIESGIIFAALFLMGPGRYSLD
ncbi:MAG TPA: DoxX family protein [Candidatus Deferrimicrobium sp.]|nr:DoxX family protein [Candidatus Deferrimicrobium sp.]